jgi:hypothetical protein
MQSPEGEKIEFRGKTVSAKADIEVWLLGVQEAMREQLQKRMKQGK